MEYSNDKIVDNILQGLNDEQKQAVTTTEGYVRVGAGPGSGKTKVLTQRFIYLVKNLGISPNNILCVTFTNKAAAEMKSRIRAVIPDEDCGWISTFHGACHKILKQDISYLNYPFNFMVMDDDDADTILKKVYEKLNITYKDLTYKKAKDHISLYKQELKYIKAISNPAFSPDIFVVDKFCGSEGEITNKVIKEYILEQRKNFYLDFHDLINFVLYLLETNEEVCKKWQELFEYIQVDEFQDVSDRQYALCSILQGRHKNLFIVGDANQTIYSWREARVEYFLNFDKKFPETQTILLNQNYRSTPEILNVCNSLIKHNEEKVEIELLANKNSGAIVHYHHAKTVYDETDYIADKILELQEKGVEKKDICILYRARNQTRPIEESLYKKKIPYYIYDGVSFYAREEIKDALSYLRLVAFGDNLSFERIVNKPAREIGKTRKALINEVADEQNISQYEALKLLKNHNLFINTGANKFIEVIEKGKILSKEVDIIDLFDFLLRESGYEEMRITQGDEERLKNLNELKQGIRDYLVSADEKVYLEDYLNNIALITSVDKDTNKNAVKMMTIHSAKGLEFPYVFVCNLNEGKFPCSWIRLKWQMEEERRLAYVAFSRAEKELYLTNCECYDKEGKNIAFESRFIHNVLPEFLEKSGAIEEDYITKGNEHIQKLEEMEDYQKRMEKKREETKQKALSFSIGDKVSHSTFGIGSVVKIDEIHISVEFEGNKYRVISADVLTKVD